MKFFKFLTLFLLTITTTVFLVNGESNNYDPGWGIGIISPLKIFNLAYKVNLPDKPISLYDKPSGSKIGNLFSSRESGLSYQELQSSLTSAVNNSDLIEADYQGYCLKYYQKVNGFVKVLLHSSQGGYWVSIKELAGLKFQAADWKYFLLNNFRGYHPVGDKGMSLYEKPVSNSKSVVLLKGDRYFINLTGKTKDQWAEALVQLYDKQPCEGGSVIKEYKGWLKIINEKQCPTIWINTEGC